LALIVTTFGVRHAFRDEVRATARFYTVFTLKFVACFTFITSGALRSAIITLKRTFPKFHGTTHQDKSIK